MKLLKYTCLLTIVLLLSNCDTNDDGFYNDLYLETSNLVQIQTQPTFTVGDNIYLNADFSRYQTEPGQTEPLDMYKTTGNASEFSFSYVIEKEVGTDTWEVVTVNDSQLDIIEGDAQNGSFVLGHCIYDSVSESYKYNVGFPLLSTGNYRLSFGYNSTSATKVELRSKPKPGKLVINMRSQISTLNSSGYYLFTVTN